MNFDFFYDKEKTYFGLEPSDGMVDAINKYNIKLSNVLDIGAGEGRNSIYLAAKGANVVSIEPSPIGSKKIEDTANKMNLELKIENSDFLGANLNQSFDFIVASTSLDHMDAAYLEKAIKKIKKLLNMEGTVYIVVFTEEDPGFQKKANASECAGYIKHYFKKNELKDLFSDFETLYYDEYMKEDRTHGPVHYHGKAKLIAKKVSE